MYRYKVVKSSQLLTKITVYFMILPASPLNNPSDASEKMAKSPTYSSNKATLQRILNFTIVWFTD